jgi:hypothetical protein
MYGQPKGDFELFFCWRSSTSTATTQKKGSLQCHRCQYQYQYQYQYLGLGSVFVGVVGVVVIVRHYAYMAISLLIHIKETTTMATYNLKLQLE